MLFTFSHTSDIKLKTLSERLRLLVPNKRANNNYNNPKIKAENLQYNLSLIISHLILKIQIIDRSKDVFEKIINEYNNSNKTSLIFEDFEKIGWIRIVSGNVVIPKLVLSFIWSVGYQESEGKPIEIPTDKIDVTKCLQIYYQRCYENEKPTILKSDLEYVLNQYADNHVTMDFLIKNEIVESDTDNKFFYWNVHNNYTKILAIEIASTMWLLIGGENATIVEFKKYFKHIQIAEIWIENLNSYLSFDNTNKIVELAQDYINLEHDLLKSDFEFRKIWLDAENHQHIDIKSEIPNVKFNYDNTIDFIESVNYYKRIYRSFFDYQRSRSFCYSLLRIIVHNDSRFNQPFQITLKIIKDTSKPFLVWTLYKEISSNYPFVIPYLLTDSELTPIAFKLIDKIVIDEVYLKEQSITDRKKDELNELINQLWIELFEFTLEQFSLSYSNDDEKGKVLIKILNDLAENVFKNINFNRNSVASHGALRKRYDEALKKISNQKINQNNVYPKQFYNPRIIISLLPYMANYQKNKLESTSKHINEFLYLRSSHFDLSIEILRLFNIRFGEEEISDVQKKALSISSFELINSLKNHLSKFYLQDEIEVQSFKAKIEKRKVRRGTSEFGFEIIDWGYLFLLFDRSNLLDKFHDDFMKSISFKTETHEYDDQNREQYEKIKLYLKSLMIAFISINEKRNLYEIDGIPVNNTLIQLQKWIIEISLLYSIDDIQHERIDVFNERFNLFDNNLYFIHLTSLLYKCINFFSDINPNEFVKTFFTSSNDLGRMLTAINILDSKEQINIISQRISDVKIETFINEVYTTTQLQYALIEAVNSENHWELAKPLIDRIQAHFKRVELHDDNREDLLFQVNLLLAFKEKDFTKLSNIEIPQRTYVHHVENEKMKQIKQFYIAIFKLYNEKNYVTSIKLLKSLLSEDTKNIRYAFHLYRAETLKAVELE